MVTAKSTAKGNSRFKKTTRQFTNQMHTGGLDITQILAQPQTALQGGARLPCLHIIAGTDQTLRFIKQSNLNPFTKTHAETPGAHVWLLGVQREERNSPMESKGLSARITNHIRKTRLSSC